MIERRDSRTEFVFNPPEKVERVMFVAFGGLAVAVAGSAVFPAGTIVIFGIQVDGDDTPATCLTVDIPDIVLPEYVQYASLPAGGPQPAGSRAAPSGPPRCCWRARIRSLAYMKAIPPCSAGDAADIDVASGRTRRR